MVLLINFRVNPCSYLLQIMHGYFNLARAVETISALLQTHRSWNAMCSVNAVIRYDDERGKNTHSIHYDSSEDMD